MRKDMAKVIVERPRRGGDRNKHNGRKARDYGDMPSKESMRKYHFDRKSLNENLRPLERFLKSKIGQHWDAVFSEICQQISVGSAVQKHVRDHLKDLIHSRVLIRDGKVFGKYRSLNFELYNGDLYVHPETKIISKYKSKNIRSRSSWTPKDQQEYRLKKLSLVYEDGKLFKIHKPKYRSPKNNGPKEVKCSANATHARQDFYDYPKDTIYEVLSKMTGELFRFPYFRELNSKWSDYCYKKYQEDQAKARKALETAKAILAQEEADAQPTR